MGKRALESSVNGGEHKKAKTDRGFKLSTQQRKFLRAETVSEANPGFIIVFNDSAVEIFMHAAANPAENTPVPPPWLDTQNAG
jgi:hypothetical protein